MDKHNTDNTSSELSSDDPPGGDSGEDHQHTLMVVLDTGEGEPIDTKWLKENMARVVDALGVKRVTLTAVVIDDARMCEMHERYAGVGGTTDVLSFDLRDDDEADDESRGERGAVVGEVYVCVDEARRRALKLGHDVKHELLLYATHGLLHLMGYDDREVEDHRVMHEKEDELFSLIGVGPIFKR